MALARPRAAVLTQGPPDRVAVVDAAADVVFELEDALSGRVELDDALVAVVEDQPLVQRVDHQTKALLLGEGTLQPGRVGQLAPAPQLEAAPRPCGQDEPGDEAPRSEEHTSELQ